MKAISTPELFCAAGVEIGEKGATVHNAHHQYTNPLARPLKVCENIIWISSYGTIFMYYMSLGFSGGGKTGVNKKKLVSICFQIMDMNNLAKRLIILTLFISLVPLLNGEVSATQTNFKIFVSCPGKYSPLN